MELHAGAEYTVPTCIQYVDAQGRTQTTVVPELFGCRNFYGGNDNDFYREACRRGLRIWKEPFGMGVLYRMELRQLYEITMQMLREDPYALLCKKPGCPFCSQDLR